VRIVATVAVALATGLVAPSARAELTSWFSLGGGVSAQREAAVDTMRGSSAVTAAVGVGSTARNPFVVGGLFRVLGMPQQGADISLSARVCTRGFARGDWGVALDVGAVARTWRSGTYGRWPLQGVVTVGVPWGFQVAGGVQAFDLAGGTAARGGFVALELDFLRLSVMRTGSTEAWWNNPAAADRAPSKPD